MDDPIFNELKAIEKRDGIIYPERVVEFASNPDTALHGKFCWDDTEAARQYRIYQARQIIRVTVRMVEMPERKEPMQVRAFVSLPEDRKDTGGYRDIVAVLGSDDLRRQLIESAKADLSVFRKKYRDITELAEVNAAIDRLFTK